MLLLFAVPARLASAQQTPDLNGLERVAVAELGATGTPGAAVAVVSGDRTVFLKGFGVASVETGLPVTPDTLFYSGGLSRLFTSAALVSLADEGKIDLSAPAGRYVTGLSPKLARLTGHQLLTSTAGLGEEHLRHALVEDSALGALVRSWGDDRVFTEPGRIYSGSHLSYALAGLLLEEAAGEPFADAVRDRVFAPLGMSRSTYRPLLAVTYPFSQGHERAPDGTVRVFRPFAESSVGLPRNSFYTAADAAQFLIALVNGGRLGGRQALPQAVVARLSRPYVPSPSADGEEEGYGGLHFSTHAGRRLLSVGTSWGGLTTLVRVAPDERFAVIVMANGDATLNKTVEEAIRLFLPAPARTAAKAVSPVPVAGAEAERLAGRYENERALRLFVRDGRLFVRDESRGPGLGSVTEGGEWPVAKVGARDFIATAPHNPQVLRFRAVEGADGKVEYLHFENRALLRK